MSQPASSPTVHTGGDVQMVNFANVDTQFTPVSKTATFNEVHRKTHRKHFGNNRIGCLRLRAEPHNARNQEHPITATCRENRRSGNSGTAAAK